MSPRIIILEAIAVLAGAIIGVIVSGFCAWLLAGISFLMLTGSIASYIVALVVVTLFAVLYRKMPPTPAALCSLFIGILVPSLLDKIVFGQSISWAMILVLNLIFALVSLLIYRLVHAHSTVRRLTPDTTHDL